MTTLGNQLDEATGNMKIVQKGIMASLSESLQVQAARALEALERSMEELARDSVERLRLKLVSGLNAAMKSVGEQFLAESDGGGSET